MRPSPIESRHTCHAPPPSGRAPKYTERPSRDHEGATESDFPDRIRRAAPPRSSTVQRSARPPPRRAEKTSRVPSGDQRGDSTRAFVSDVTRRGASPFAPETHTSCSPERVDTKATREPSGERSGWKLHSSVVGATAEPDGAAPA